MNSAAANAPVAPTQLLPMTMEEYKDLMSQGLFDSIDQQAHDQFFADWYQDYYGFAINAIVNRNNVPGEMNARKSSGRLGTNAFKAFKLKQKKRIVGPKRNTRQQKKNLNKRTKKRRQFMDPGRRLNLGINNAYNNYSNVTNKNNNSNDDNYDRKIDAVNKLVEIIRNSRTVEQFKEELDKPVSAYDSLPLRSYFENKLSLDKKYLDKKSKDYKMYSSESTPLIDFPSNIYYFHRFNRYWGSSNDYNDLDYFVTYFYTPLLAAINKADNRILNEVLKFKPNIELALHIAYNNYNQLGYSTDTLIEICKRLKNISDEAISSFLHLDKEFFANPVDFALLYCDGVYNRKKANMDQLLSQLFNPYTFVYFNILDLIEYRNINVPNAYLTQALKYILNITDLGDFNEYVQELLNYIVTKINPNKGLDEDENTILMLLLRAQLSNITNDISSAINKVLLKPELDINKKNNLGETALAIAVKLGKRDIANRLMGMEGINLQAKNIYGRKIINILRRGMAASAAPPAAATAAPANNNNNNINTGRTNRSNNYRNMMQTYIQHVGGYH